MQFCRYDIWVIARESEIPGVWTAHALDFDIVAQGSNPLEALSNVRDATGFTIAEDLNAGRDPRSRVADKRYWDELETIRQHGRQVDQSQLTKIPTSKNFVAIANMAIQLERIPERPIVLENAHWNVPLYLLPQAPSSPC